MFEYYLQLVTDEYRTGNTHESSALPEVPKADKKIVKGKFLRDLEALQQAGYSLASGSTIQISLKEILQILPRDRRRTDAYSKLTEYLNNEFGVTLIIKSQKSKNHEI